MVADLLEVSVAVDGVGKFIRTQPRSHVGFFFCGNEVIFVPLLCKKYQWIQGNIQLIKSVSLLRRRSMGLSRALYERLLRKGRIA